MFNFFVILLYLLLSRALWDWPLTWLMNHCPLVLWCYDAVGWVMWPIKSAAKWRIMCQVGWWKLLYLYLSCTPFPGWVNQG